jgi:DMSO reductase family type II enzyme heme b subunit
MGHTTSFLVLTLLTLACSAPHEPVSGFPEELSEVRAADRLARGATLYGIHCSVCHGPNGAGDGPASPFLFPPARDFGTGRFRLVSSTNGAPFDGDLVATLRRGVPGSAMPAWNWLAERDLWALAAYVRELALTGFEERLLREGEADGDPTLFSEAARLAEARLTPLERIAPLPAVAAEPDPARGAALFARHCAECHGPDGRGQREPRRNEDGTLNWARDLTAGFLKGGDSPSELTARVRGGLPGTAMPPTELAPDDERALIAHVRALIPRDSAMSLVHTRETLVAARVAEAPAAPEAREWAAAEEIEVVLAPLWWHEAAVLGARLSALHDGTHLAVRLSWPDATGELTFFGTAGASDGAALQLSAALRPPLFGMGAEGEPTSLLHWQALRVEDVVTALDWLDPLGHARSPTRADGVRADVPRYERLLGRVEPSQDVERIRVDGIESILGATRRHGAARASARWSEGEWSVVFHRPLAGEDASDVTLTPGGAMQLACAVWNGAGGDHGARKSISIWQELILEP